MKSRIKNRIYNYKIVMTNYSWCDLKTTINKNKTLFMLGLKLFSREFYEVKI